jgi:hypothetical protein
MKKKEPTNQLRAVGEIPPRFVADEVAHWGRFLSNYFRMYHSGLAP